MRLPIETFKNDSERMRDGYYSDDYFENQRQILETLAKEGYQLDGVDIGDIEVCMQVFTRRESFSIVAGTDNALSILRECTGVYTNTPIANEPPMLGEEKKLVFNLTNTRPKWINTSHDLDITCVHDGEKVGKWDPVMHIRGRYRDFANLETLYLGVLAKQTRVATNVYNTLVASGGKPVLFFPARFEPWQLQAMSGYAYKVAVDKYNYDFGKKVSPAVSTHGQADWWHGTGGGTIAHAYLLCFMKHEVEAMVQYARIAPVRNKRVFLCDVDNDCVNSSVNVARVMWAKYVECIIEGRPKEAEKYKLFGVRPDTGGNMVDKSIEVLGDPKLDCGVNPRLVRNIREALDGLIPHNTRQSQIGDLYYELTSRHRRDGVGKCELWQTLDLKTYQDRMGEHIDDILNYFRDIKIVVTGGFNPEKIAMFERMGVPADIYGVGSSLIEGENNDYTADIVAIKIEGEWKPMSKIGRSEKPFTTEAEKIKWEPLDE